MWCAFSPLSQSFINPHSAVIIAKSIWGYFNISHINPELLLLSCFLSPINSDQFPCLSWRKTAWCLANNKLHYGDITFSVISTDFSYTRFSLVSLDNLPDFSCVYCGKQLLRLLMVFFLENQVVVNNYLSCGSFQLLQRYLWPLGWCFHEWIPYDFTWNSMFW